jgi:hypothetical protein
MNFAQRVERRRARTGVADAREIGVGIERVLGQGAQRALAM